MSRQNEFITSERVNSLLADQSKIDKIKNAPETLQLFSMLNKMTSGQLEHAAANAANGAPEQLVDALQEILKDPRGAQLVNSIQQKFK